MIPVIDNKMVGFFMNKILLALILVTGVSTIAEAGKGRQPCSGKKVVLVTVKVRNLFAMMDLLVNPKKYVDAKVILWALILEKV
jgi:hypothetical protein